MSESGEKNEAARRLDELRKTMPEEMGKLEQAARELGPESRSFEEFAAAFGFGVCERCGREGLDEENETDCTLIPGGPGGVLVCLRCVSREDAEKLWEAEEAKGVPSDQGT